MSVCLTLISFGLTPLIDIFILFIVLGAPENHSAATTANPTNNHIMDMKQSIFIDRNIISNVAMDVAKMIGNYNWIIDDHFTFPHFVLFLSSVTKATWGEWDYVK